MKPRSPLPAGLPVHYVALGAVLLAAVVARLSDLPEWWLNPDEGIYYSILTRADLAAFWHELSGNAHPPLYYFLLRGLGWLSWDFGWLRLSSVASGVVAVGGVYAAARGLAGRGARGEIAGVGAALVLAFAPGAVIQSQVMRPYMFQLACLAWALFFLVRYMEKPATRDLGAYLGLVCLALATHYSSILALVVFGFVVAVDGLQHGVRRKTWQRLVVAHVVPASTIAILYFVHLRPLASSALADEALDGWLSYFMIGAPADIWWNYLGFQHLVAAPWLRGPTAILLVATLGVSLAKRDWRMLSLLGGGLIVATVGASTGVYPFGSSRHSSWLLVFAVPALGWLMSLGLARPWKDAPIRRRAAWIGGPLVLVLLGGPVGDLIGMQRARWPQSEQVVRQADMVRIVEVLDPSSGPELIVMSAQTFYLLIPFYPIERESAVFTADSTAFHFPYGNRRILVSSAWDFTANEAGVDVLSDNGVYTADVRSFLGAARDAFPELAMGERDDALLLVGGWRPDFLDELRALAEASNFIRSWQSVPGFYAFEVALGPLTRVRAPRG